MTIPDSNKTIQRRITKLATRSGVLSTTVAIRSVSLLRKWDRAFRWLVRNHQRLLERHEIDNFKNVIKPGMTVLDIGANSGTFTQLVSEIVGPTGKVYAFEPAPSNFKALSRLVKYKNLRNVGILNVALSSKSGKETLFIDKLSPCNHSFAKDNLLSYTGDEIEVKTLSLDDFMPSIDKVDVIKIDVQGAEGLVFSGGQKLLKQDSPLSIFLEFWPSGMKKLGSDPIEFLQMFIDKGFTINILDKGSSGKIEVDLEDVERLVSSWSDDTDYTNILLEKIRN